jgi:hypothetical protein
MAPRTPSCRSGCPLWTWKRMTCCSCPNLSHRLAIAGVFVMESSGFMKNPCDSYHVICHMRERDHEWKLYIYRSFIMYMYVPKNANNTSQNSQCVCVCGCGCGICKWYLQARPQMPTASPESLANITCIKDLGCNATFKWLKQLHVMLLLEVSDDRWRRRWDFSGGATL